MRRLPAALLIGPLAGLLAGLGACRPDPDHAARTAMVRAAAYLWAQQGEDGGWHSGTYGLLGSGRSLTPLVLLALLELPADIPRPAHGVARAVGFLRRHVDDAGAVGLGDGVVADYPNYATALAVQALQGAGSARPAGDALDRMRAYLSGQQFTEALGWQPADPPYGGWGMGGAPRRAPDHGHLDLSMTRHVLEAFATPGHGDASHEGSRARRALAFLTRCQNRDGGFLFSPAVEGIHKARVGDQLLSYGTTTADGVLALLALGVPADDERLQRAVRWLLEHHRVDRVPGFPQAQRGTWDLGLRYYWLAASSRALARVPVPESVRWRGAVRRQLVAWQRADGSWQNPSRLVKEDDPLIATALALRALVAARAGETRPE